jgi:hypothetical protein
MIFKSGYGEVFILHTRVLDHGWNSLMNGGKYCSHPVVFVTPIFMSEMRQRGG